MEILNFDDSMDSLDEPVNRHPLHAVSEQLDFNGYGRILNETRDDVETERVKNAFYNLLKRETELMRRVSDSVEEHKKTQADLKRMISRNESLTNDVEQRDRHIAECKSRELKQLKRNDELELKLRKKTEESRKLTISSKNAESKFNIDKRKLEMVNAKFKDKISDLTKGATAKERQKRFDAVINIKKQLDSFQQPKQTRTSVTALQQSEEGVRELVAENETLKGVIRNAKAQIYETLSAFPNYTVSGKSSELDLQINPQKIEIDIATHCQAVIDMIRDLNGHNQRRISEMEKDLEARQEKHLVTKVAEFENKLDEVKAQVKEQKQPVSEEDIFQQMAQIVQNEEENDEAVFESMEQSNEQELIKNYLRDCSNQTPESANRSESSNERTPENLARLMMRTESDADENEYTPQGVKSHSTPLHQQLVTNLMQSPVHRRSGSSEGLKSSHLFPSSKRYDDDSLEI